jgi:hypothetical protein
LYQNLIWKDIFKESELEIIIILVSINDETVKSRRGIFDEEMDEPTAFQIVAGMSPATIYIVRFH